MSRCSDLPITLRAAQAVHLTRELAQAATPTTLFADFYRVLLKTFGGSAKAPNGDDVSNYGQAGTRISEKFLALLDFPLNPIESLLVNRLMNPFIHFCCRPFRKFAKKIKRGGDSDFVEEQKVVDFGVIAHIARVIVCMLANVCLAAAIGALNSIDGSTTRIVVMSVIGLVFAVLVSFLGQDSILIYSLITA